MLMPGVNAKITMLTNMTGTKLSLVVMVIHPTGWLRSWLLRHTLYTD